MKKRFPSQSECEKIDEESVEEFLDEQPQNVEEYESPEDVPEPSQGSEMNSLHKRKISFDSVVRIVEHESQLEEEIEDKAEEKEDISMENEPESKVEIEIEKELLEEPSKESPRTLRVCCSAIYKLINK